MFKQGIGQNFHWAKSIWSPEIPPSKSLVVWRLMHNKLPSDENLLFRGCYFPSMCSVCKSCSETTYHLFFECAFALNLWAWFGSILNSSIQINSMDDIGIIMNKNWSPQCKVVIKACFINILNVIWFNRNQSRFQDKFLGWRPAINLIIAKVSLSGNNTIKSSSISMQEFSILKACNVSVKPPR